MNSTINGSDMYPQSPLNYNGTLVEVPDFESILRDYKNSLSQHTEPRVIVLITLYVPIFLAALVGNVLVLLLLVSDRRMRTSTNLFLGNLAAADLLVTLLCIPPTIAETIYKVWTFGDFMCKTTAFLQGVSVAASVLTLMFMSLERFVAIRYPVKLRKLCSKKRIKVGIFVIWLASTAIMTPLVTVRRLQLGLLPDASIAFCNEVWSSKAAIWTFDICMLLFIYLTPGGVIVVVYSLIGCKLITTVRHSTLHRMDSEVTMSQHMINSRRRVARVMMTLSILFACCWLPYFTMTCYLDFTFDERETLSTVHLYTLMLGHSHSGINPMVYFFMNNKFRMALRRIFCCCCWYRNKNGYFLDLPIEGSLRFRSTTAAFSNEHRRNHTSNNSKHFRRKKTCDALENNISGVKIENGHIHAWQAMNNSVIDITENEESTNQRHSL